MRLSTFLRLCLAAAALVPASAVAHAVPGEPGASCAADGRAFPLSTRIHGGPSTYEAGGGYGTWFLDLKNTTDRTCEDVHPVVVLVDQKRALRASQPRLEFYAEGRPHPVRFETTDRDELVGAFDAGVPGLTIGPRQTRTVKVRLALTSDAVANEVTATAAVVQRRDDDGDWIGQSNDYRFRIRGAGSGDGQGHGRPDGSEAETADGGAGVGGDASGLPPREGESAAPTAPGVLPPGRQSLADELARTGVSRARTALAVAALLVAAGCALVFVRRRL
ncbi:hypothetical protein [Streptomyces sp. DH24]|uniref:hypothetical protein n=1 Tax=Streptomyces sp. DH24 TaxID=3040123 RepID=UPI0024419E9B|nr:hypothetical protein [Streptomyces sp. DH24]MDG9721046.1 hypothetical protein [Streptomyces sp. DH24]